jgi:hypothetical protein
MAVVNAGAAAQPVWLDVSRAEASTPAITLTAEQGRELARLQVQEMIRKVRTRAREHRLDRGLTVSLPYFDEGAQELRWRELVIIPRGRIPFVPAFVVLAARQEIEHVLAEAGLSETTQAHLVELLQALAGAFAS